MNDRTTRAKIEIRLELRQLVLLSLGTMTFSGSLFAVGYWLGTRDGLQSAASPTTAIVQVDRTERGSPPTRVKPTKAALGEVEFLFAKPAAKKKRRVEPRPLVKITKTETLDLRRLPKLKVRTKPVKKARVVLPKLPALPSRLRAKKEVSEPLKTADTKRSTISKTVDTIAEPKPSKSQSTASKPTSRNIKSPKVAALVSAIDAELREGSSAAKRDGSPAPLAEVKVVQKTQSSTIKVTVPKVPAPKPKTVTKRPKPSHYFTVQVKAVTDKGEADSFSASLRSRGFKPNVVLANIPEKGRYYRIRVGKFASLDEARRFQQEIKAKGNAGVRGFVTRY